jgi:CheY-like chemotaxis protein
MSKALEYCRHFETIWRFAACIMEANKKRQADIRVLLVEDKPGDVRLTQEVFGDANKNVALFVATDGVEARAFLRHEGVHADAPRPDFILLDLNLPKMDGREVLALSSSGLKVQAAIAC